MESNELLNKVLAENIDKLGSGVEAAVDFTLEQAPEVIQQALYWNAALSVTECVFGIVYAIVLIISILKTIKVVKTKNPSGDEIFLSITAGAFGFGIASIPAFAYCNLTWLKIWIAPKVWLIEYAASLVK